MKTDKIKISKLLALGLRHQPEALGLTLNANGWADSAAVIKGVRERGYDLTQTLLRTIVAEDDKGRYALSPDGRKIRANQGHSVKDVDVGLKPTAPPAVLYHGTSQKSVGAILAGGLSKMSRQHVHLSPDIATALRVGGRRSGETVVFTVDAGRAHADGLVFFVSDNGVWLTDAVPASYLEILAQ